jgi:hypothetical protein
MSLYRIRIHHVGGVFMPWPPAVIWVDGVGQNLGFRPTPSMGFG